MTLLEERSAHDMEADASRGLVEEADRHWSRYERDDFWMLELTDEQRAEYVKMANQARTDIKNVKQELHDGKITLEEALHDPRMHHTKLLPVLKALPHVGTKRAERIIELAEVDPRRRVSGLKEPAIRRIVKVVDTLSARW